MNHGWVVWHWQAVWLSVTQTNKQNTQPNTQTVVLGCLKEKPAAPFLQPPVRRELPRGHGDNEERNFCRGDGEESTTGAVLWEWLKGYVRKTAWNCWGVREVSPEALQRKQWRRLPGNKRERCCMQRGAMKEETLRCSLNMKICR